MLLKGDNPSTYGVLNKIDTAVDVQLLHQAAFIPLYRLRADHKHFGYLTGSMPLSCW
jgi:hypothetical protein